MKTLSTNLNVRTFVFSALIGLISITITPTATAGVKTESATTVTNWGSVVAGGQGVDETTKIRHHKYACYHTGCWHLVKGGGAKQARTY